MNIEEIWVGKIRELYSALYVADYKEHLLIMCQLHFYMHSSNCLFRYYMKY